MKELRASSHGALARKLAASAAGSFGVVAGLARAGLGAVAVARALPLGARAVELAGDAASALLPGLVPRLPRGLALPRPAPALAPEEPPPLPAAAARSGERSGVVYFPSCLTRIVGPLPGENGVPASRAMRELLRWAGYSVRVPEAASGLCCGMAFASKGYAEAAEVAARRTAEALWRASSGGRLPVVTDASPCAGTLAEAVAGVLRETGREVRMLDFPAFWAREVLPRVAAPPRRPGLVVVHPTCTLIKAGGLSDLLTVARAHAERVELPLFAECCGFAGDKGFHAPELTASATATEAAEIRRLLERDPGAACVSTCRTCEIGLARAVGRPFRSLFALVHEAVTRA
jgi:D-lactate dehydrogenase